MITSISDFRFAIVILCRLFDCTESSGYRTPKHNTIVGGTPTSQHKEGGASDLVPDENTPEKREEVAKAAEKIGLWVKVYDRHVHIQMYKKHNQS